MSSNPLKPSFRYPAALPAGVAHDSVVKAIQNSTNGLVDVNQAIVAIQSKIDSLKTVTNTVTTSSGGRAVPVPSPFPFPGLGADNNQTGNTAYTVVSTDNGILLILNDASPVAVTLDSTLVRPYLLFITNFGAGAATLTPSSGLINGSASLVMAQHETLMAVFDGTNWLTSDLLVLAQTFVAVTHEFLTAYDAATGAFHGGSTCDCRCERIGRSFGATCPNSFSDFHWSCYAANSLGTDSRDYDNECNVGSGLLLYLQRLRGI